MDRRLVNESAFMSRSQEFGSQPRPPSFIIVPESSSFVPCHHNRVSNLLGEMAEVLRWRLIGQLITMVIIGVSTWIRMTIIGVPGALVLPILVHSSEPSRSFWPQHRREPQYSCGRLASMFLCKRGLRAHALYPEANGGATPCGHSRCVDDFWRSLWPCMYCDGNVVRGSRSCRSRLRKAFDV